MIVQLCTRSVLRAGRFASRSAAPRRTVTNSAPGRPVASENAGDSGNYGSMPPRWTGLTVLAVAAGAGAAGWAIASFGQGAGAPWAGFVPGYKKTLLDADRPPRFANIREMEKVRLCTLEDGYFAAGAELDVASICYRTN